MKPTPFSIILCVLCLFALPVTLASVDQQGVLFNDTFAGASLSSNWTASPYTNLATISSGWMLVDQADEGASAIPSINWSKATSITWEQQGSATGGGNRQVSVAIRNAGGSGKTIITFRYDAGNRYIFYDNGAPVADTNGNYNCIDTSNHIMKLNWTSSDWYFWCDGNYVYNWTRTGSANNFTAGAASSMSSFNVKWDNVVVWNNITVVPTIEQITYNLSSAYANETTWRQDTTFPIPTIDTMPTVRFDTDVAAYCRVNTADQNWSTMGNARNCTTTGGTSHVCTVAAADEYSYSTIPQELYIGCIDSSLAYENSSSTSGPLNISVSGVDETDGRAAIIAGLDASEISSTYTSYTDRQIAIRLANGSQYQGSFDLFVEAGSKRWAFNYDQTSSSGFPTFQNITPVFWFWESSIMAPDDITAKVKSFVNNTN